METTVWCDLII